ncbi:MAG: methyltransferase domain-containing protein [Candidatus Hydrogenedentes bacterium]|nr:methyltransferase domain-containing protein [Candidatus Hydrogenedentota bacterium]
MSAFANVRARQLEPEIMDQPGLDSTRHAEALRGLSRINLLSGTCSALWTPLKRWTLQHPGVPLRVLDVASGGGEIAIGLRHRAARMNLPITVDGCDRNQTAVAYALNAARSNRVDANFYTHDVIQNGIPEGYDAITCALFMHHLTDEEARGFLRHAADTCKLIVISDLIRSRGGLALAHLACRALTRSEVVHNDGPSSVAAAFTIEEFRRLATDAGLHGHRISWQWPFRFLFTWCRS